MSIINFLNVNSKNGKYNIDSLTEEIKDNILLSNKYEYICTSSNGINIYFIEELTTEENESLNVIILNHEGVSPDIKEIFKTVPNEVTIANIKMRIDSAVNFGQEQIRIFTVENVALGITQLGLTNHVLTITMKLVNCLTTGSLYEAINEIKNLDPLHLDSIILTANRLKKFRNNLEKFLALPLSQNWYD